MNLIELQAFRINILLLLKNQHPVIYLLPRRALTKHHRLILPIEASTQPKHGLTIHFQAEPVINFYSKFVTRHDVILDRVGTKVDFLGRPVHVFPLMRTNIDELCGINVETLYLLHPPDQALQKKAIESFVDYFSPDTEEEKNVKPEWVLQYELIDLMLQSKEDQVNLIEQEVEKLLIKKEQLAFEIEKVAKWSDLITTQAKTLELRLKGAFEFLGVEKVTHEPKGAHGPDLELSHKHIGFTVEIEGSKNSIKIEKARELLHWIADAPPHHKGLLIGNPFRELDLSQRPPTNAKLFAKEAEDLAVNRNFVLITSHDVFKLVCKKIRGEEINLEEVLQRIYSAKGHVTFE